MGPGIAIWHCNNARPRFLPHSRSLEQELDFERLLRKFDATFRDAIKDAALIGRMRYCKTQLMPSEKANARAPACLTCGVLDRNAVIPSYGALALLRPVGLQDHSSTCVVECPMACHWHAISGLVSLEAMPRSFSPLGFRITRRLASSNVQWRATGTPLVEPAYGSHPIPSKTKRLRLQALLFGARDRNRTGTTC